MSDLVGASQVTRPGPRVVALGGGRGLATTIRAARRYAGSLTAIVSVADDGGSSGRLREIAGIPAPGDLRRCLVAMAGDDNPWASAFEYRFPAGSGDLAGHALGNLMIAGLANVTGDFGAALDLAAGMLAPVGRVLPATSVPVVLKADVSGHEVLGEVAVSETSETITEVSIVPPDASVPPEALAAIEAADQIVLGPGSLFTSVLAVAAVPGILSALEARSRGVIYVCNLRPQLPETASFTDVDHLRAVLDHGVPVDVMVAPSPGSEVQRGSEGERGAGNEPAGERMLGVPVVRSASLEMDDPSGHDPVELAALLCELP